MSSTPPASVHVPAPPHTPPHTPKPALPHDDEGHEGDDHEGFPHRHRRVDDDGRGKRQTSFLSCPAAADIVQLFQQHSAARNTGERLPHNVRRCDTTHSALTSALEYLHDHDPTTWQFLSHDLRWEYNSCTNVLYFRMSPKPFHETIRQHVEREIDVRIRRAIEICESLSPKTRELVIALWDKDIERTGSADVKFGKDSAGAVLSTGGQLSPDASWRFRHADNPVAVLEVAWSEDMKHLEDKCAHYIEAAPNSTIRTVIGVKCDYSESNLGIPRTRVLLFRRAEADGEYWLEARGPQDIRKDRTMNLRLIDFVPRSIAQTESDIQQRSDEIGDVALPFSMFRDIVQRANLMRQPPLTDAGSSSTLRLRKRQRLASEDRDTDEESAPTTATQSFESVEGPPAEDSEYRPSSRKAPVIATAIPVRRSSERVKRVKTSADIG